MSDVIAVPGRTHIAHLRENRLRTFVRRHRLFCYALAVLFILLMVAL